VQLVTGAILARWRIAGYETGSAGSPTASASSFQTFNGTSGVQQTFQSGLIVNPTVGPYAGSAFLVSPPVLSIYNARGGMTGDLGAPTSEDQNQRQEFEGGTVTYGNGTAIVAPKPRVPSISATPSTVIAGAPVHLILGGFANNATVKVSVTGRPDFTVTVPSGSYAWDAPAPTQTGAVTIHAADTTGATADGSFTVTPAVLNVSIVSGDQQTGAPGAQLASPLVVVVKDQNGNPVPNQTVTFAASPGGSVAPLTATTGSNGQASTLLRMPVAEGLALATASAGKSVATFSASAKAFSFTNFPSLQQPDGKSAMITAAASILRYHQQRGEMPQNNGLADPVTLTTFLKSFCAGTVCDGVLSYSGSDPVPNLWRLAAFTGGSVDVQPASTADLASQLNFIRDSVFAGSPVLLGLGILLSNPAAGQPPILWGSHFVVATGIAADGSILISDPAQLQTNLGGYLKGANSTAFISALIRLAPQPPAMGGFLVGGSASISIASVAGQCGNEIVIPRTAVAFPITLPPAPPSPDSYLYFQGCDGQRDLYQLDLSALGPFESAFTDLTANSRVPFDSSGANSFMIARSGSGWDVRALSAGISAGGVINPASLTPQIAPGGFISIYGIGFGASTKVQINSKPASIVAALPFLVNAVVPIDTAPGAATLSVAGVLQSITISNVAPAIFSVGNGQAAITNLDNSLNTPSNPESIGRVIVIYGTGLGAVQSGALPRAVVPVTAVIGGVELQVSYAGATPGVPGLYQVNVPLPVGLPPGLSLPLYLKQGGAVSNTVAVSVQ
jgi:uncharacterized protein (TIGR03437 family)